MKIFRAYKTEMVDASLSEIQQQLEYKSKWYGVELLKADRFYPYRRTARVRSGITYSKGGLR